jgi:hypothetical protein
MYTFVEDTYTSENCLSDRDTDSTTKRPVATISVHTNLNQTRGKADLMNPKADVLVAMSFIGMAACRPIRGVWNSDPKPIAATKG